MTDELHKWLLHEQTHLGGGGHHVYGAVHWKHGAQLTHLHHLTHHTLPTETRQAFVPDGG